VDSGEPKEAKVQWYSHGGAIVRNFNRIRLVAPMYPTTLCRELCTKRLNRSICRLDFWFVDSGGPQEAQAQPYSPGNAHMCPMCPDGRARWRHLANTIEPSICGGDAVLYQITLTTC